MNNCFDTWGHSKQSQIDIFNFRKVTYLFASYSFFFFIDRNKKKGNSKIIYFLTGNISYPSLNMRDIIVVSFFFFNFSLFAS